MKKLYWQHWLLIGVFASIFLVFAMSIAIAFSAN